MTASIRRIALLCLLAGCWNLAFAEVLLQYKGQPLTNHEYSQLEDPGVTAVSATIRLRNITFWRPNHVFYDQDQIRDYVSIDVTDGVRHFDLKNGLFKLWLTFDEKGAVLSWTLLARSKASNVLIDRDIHISTTSVPDKKCDGRDESADARISEWKVDKIIPTRIYVISSCSRGNWNVIGLPLRGQADVKLVNATTTDASSVIATYRVSNGTARDSITFTVYRSPAPDTAPASGQLKQPLTMSDSGCIEGAHCLDEGTHSVRLVSGTPLVPDTARRYIVVVAQSGGSKSSTYFRKYLLGVVAHGFDRWNAKPDWTTSVPVALFYKFMSGGTPDWENKLAAKLRNEYAYDDVVAFDWTSTCALPQPDMAVQAGFMLGAITLRHIQALRTHAGDVADIHFIGHSRGTVVVGQALKYLTTADPTLGGGYVDMTLLDPHPANNSYESKWVDIETTADGSGSQFGVLARWFAESFQAQAKDPPVELTKGPARVVIWQQKTAATCLASQVDQEGVMNLWGIVNSRAIINSTGLEPIRGPEFSCEEAIGHNQVPEAFLRKLDTEGSPYRTH